MGYLDYSGLSHFLDKLKTIFVSLTQKGAANGVAELDSTGKVPTSQIPSLSYIPTSQKGAANGVAELDSTGKVPSGQLPAMNYIPTSEKGAANGVAQLDANSKVPIAQLPELVDDVIEGYYYNGSFYEEAAHTTLIAGVSGKIYVSKDTNKIYRFENNAYSEIANTDVMTGATASTAGTKGLAPAPAAGKNVQYLKGDGTWDSPAMTELNLSIANGKVCMTYTEE